MRTIRADASLDFVTIDGLPEGAVFCGPTTCEVLVAQLRDGRALERPCPDSKYLHISDVIRCLKLLVARRGA